MGLASGQTRALVGGMSRIFLRRNEPLARYTTFHIGGPADLFAVARSEKDLLSLITYACDQDLDFLILGHGSNVLVSDLGVRGLVILNRVSDYHFVFQRGANREMPITTSDDMASSPVPDMTQFDKGGDSRCTLFAASGASLGYLAHRTVARGLGGLEWAAGIPGTLGGAIVQNAGAYGSCMADVVLQARVVSVCEKGLDRRIERQMSMARLVIREELAFGYRTSCFRQTGLRSSKDVILSADLQLIPQPQEQLQVRMADHMSHRRPTQPRIASAGSVFKNPPGDYAGRLIENAGLKGIRRRGAMVAPQHANFIVNTGDACACDVKALVDRVRGVVAQRFGVDLELEIQLVGDWHESCD